MPVKIYKPTSAGQRWKTGYDFSDLTKKRPEKSLLVTLKKTGGRNSYGRITARGIGGGHKQKYRIIDFKRDKIDMPARVIAIEYDPCRTSRIALIKYDDGVKNYILAPVNLKTGDVVMSGPNAEIKDGNALPLENIPMGIPIHNIEFTPGQGGKIGRSAGDLCTILSKEGNYAQVRMPSGEVRMISLKCFATIGQIGNIEHDTISIGKAGRSRYLGIRPLSRAVAMNPVDHPMGGGEGKASGGRHPCSPKGLPAKGRKTRNNKRTQRFILRRRK